MEFLTRQVNLRLILDMHINQLHLMCHVGL